MRRAHRVLGPAQTSKEPASLHNKLFITITHNGEDPMQDYDVVLKLLLRGSAKLLLTDLAGTTVARWLNVELPELVNRRVDLLGETDDGTLIQIDLQSGHDKTMALRMAEYALAI